MNKLEIILTVGLGLNVAACEGNQAKNTPPSLVPEAPTQPSYSIKEYPTSTPSPNDDKYTVSSYIVPIDEIISLRSFDVPTFPKNYEPDKTVDVTYFSPFERDQMIDWRAMNKEGQSITLYIDSGSDLMSVKVKEIIKRNGIDVVISVDEKSGITTYQWIYNGDTYALSGFNEGDLEETMSTMAAFN